MKTTQTKRKSLEVYKVYVTNIWLYFVRRSEVGQNFCKSCNFAVWKYLLEHHFYNEFYATLFFHSSRPDLQTKSFYCAVDICCSNITSSYYVHSVRNDCGTET